VPVIKVWCLPKGDEADFNKLHQEIVRAVLSVPELGLRDEKDMTCLFPPDLMQYGLGDEIIVEISALYEKPERTAEVRQCLATRVGEAVKRLYPQALVECSVATVNPAQGYWLSKAPG
jgi:CRISPR/Cas system-associated endonuclease Cas3-HD